MRRTDVGVDRPGADPMRLSKRVGVRSTTAVERDGETVIAPPEPGGTFLLSAKRL